MTITITRDEFYHFIKNNSDTDNQVTKRTQHYLKYYDKYKETDDFTNTNWAGILTVIWLIYRRMNFFALLFVISSVGVELICNYLDMVYYTRFISIGYVIFCIKSGDFLYLYFANEQVKKGEIKSGVNYINAVILIIIILLVSVLLVF